MARRPKHKLPAELAAGLPLFGRDGVGDDDVAAMIRADFHDDPRFVNDPAVRRRFARRGALMVALPALAGVTSTAIARMKLDDYDAAAATLRVRVHGRQLELPVTPALKFVLDAWIAARPADKGPALLPSERGTPGARSVAQFLDHLGWRLGAQRPLQTLLAAYHRAHLAHAGRGAYRTYWRVRPARDRPRPETGKALRPLVAAADPFAGRIGFLTRPHRSGALLRAARTALPAAAHTLSATKQGRRLSDDDPLFRALATVWRRGRNDRNAALDRLFERHGAAIDAALLRGISLRSMIGLAGCSHRSFSSRLDAWRAGHFAPRPRTVRRRPSPRRNPPTDDERKRLDAIAATVWPVPRRQVDRLRRQTLAEHFPFVRRLLRERKIGHAAARRLFRLSPKQLSLRVFDLDNGLFQLALAPRPGFRARRLAQALLVREYAAAPKQSATQLWKRLRLDFHYPLDWPAFASHLHRHFGSQAPRRQKARPRGTGPAAAA